MKVTEENKAFINKNELLRLKMNMSGGEEESQYSKIEFYDLEEQRLMSG
jgi:hypothetical protein